LAASFCGALALPAVLYEHPLVLAAALCATVGAGLAAGVGTELRRAARFGLPFALLVVAINPLVSQGGETVLLRGGELLGRSFDVTLEALAYGAVAGLRVLILVMAFALFSAAVDPDAVLRVFRRLSHRSALTASLALRLVPVLARDAGRMGDAARCRPTPPPRGAVARAALAGALDRAVDVAAALEVRGYASARRPPRMVVPWSRHDVHVAVSAAAIVLVGVGGAVLGAAAFDPYPRLALALGPSVALLCAALLLLAIAPFAVPAARLGVARV